MYILRLSVKEILNLFAKMFDQMNVVTVYFFFKFDALECGDTLHNLK